MSGRSALISGADAFLLAVERMMLEAGQGEHRGLTFLELGPGFDGARFRSAVERFESANPIAAAQLHRPFLGVPRWKWSQEARAHFPVTEHPPDADPIAIGENRLNEISSARVRFDLVPHTNGSTAVVMCWRHALLDGKGAELLLAELARLADTRDAEAQRRSWGPTELRRLPWRAFLSEAEQFKDYFYRNARLAIRSLAGPQPRAGAARFVVERFTLEESARIAQRASDVTRGMFLLAWFLAVTVRAHRAVFLSRGEEPESYQASCAVQERKRGARYPIWQNQVSQLFFCVRAAEAADTRAMARTLHEQFIALSRTRMQHAFSSMAALFRRLPPAWYLRFVLGNSGGQLTSFFYSHTGQFLPECEHFAGAAIRDGWHVPAVSAPPGTGIFFSEHSGRLSATVSWRDSVLNSTEIALLRSTLREELLGA